MLLLDRKPLSTEALNDPKNSHYDFAVEYDNTLRFLQEHYKNGYIRFKRPGFPKHCKGADSQGNEIPKMAEPTPPMRIPLRAYVTLGKLGKHLWTCCLDAPEVLPNGLYDLPKLSSNKSISIKEDILVNINDQPDLAFFLYKISPFVQKRRLQVVDHQKDDEAIGLEAREETERKYAVWNLLDKEDKLKTMARAYDVNNVDDKQLNAIRRELEATLLKNDALKRNNPAVKGTKEFIEEMKVTDSVLLRNFVQKAIDEKKLSCELNGDWKVGNKVIYKVTATELKDTKLALCNYLSAGNNIEKLQEFLRDLLNAEYFDGITDKKEWEWFANVSGFNPKFKKLEEIKMSVKKYYCPTLVEG